MFSIQFCFQNIRKLLIATLITSPGLLAAETIQPIVIIQPYVGIGVHKTFARGTLPRKGVWYGLYCAKTSCEIKVAPVRIKSSKEEDVLGEKVPVDVLTIRDKPIALFYGVSVKLGKVATWFIPDPNQSMYGSDHYSKLQKLGSWQMPWSNKPLSISRVKLPEFGGFRYHVSDGTVKQFLFRTEVEGHYGGPTTPYIHWVGDLNGDKKIDFLIGFPDDNCAYDERLYMSTYDTSKRLLNMTAQFHGVLPACGC